MLGGFFPAEWESLDFRLRVLGLGLDGDGDGCDTVSSGAVGKDNGIQACGVPLGSWPGDDVGPFIEFDEQHALPEVVDETTLCSRDANVLVETEGDTNVLSVGEGVVEGGTDFFLPASTLRMMRGFPEEEPSVDMLMDGLFMTPTPTVTNEFALPFTTTVFVLGRSVSSESLPTSTPSALPIPSPTSTPLGTPTLSRSSPPLTLLDG